MFINQEVLVCHPALYIYQSRSFGMSSPTIGGMTTSFGMLKDIIDILKCDYL